MKKRTFWILLVLLLLVFGISSFFVVREISERKHTKNLYEDLARQVGTEEDPVPASETIPFCPTEQELETTENTFAEMTEEPEQTEPALLPEYIQLHEMNPDMIGWIVIEDTTINLPVMYAPDRPDYYLRRDFTGERNRYGCLYVQEECDPEKPSDNLIIHGHDMYKDRMMFGDLTLFQEKDFWENHRTFRFDTLKEHGTYEIIAVARTTPREFPYYKFFDAETEEQFDAYVQTCKEISLYDTGVTAEYGDKLLTLSTCIYHTEGGRLIVVAKKVY